MSTVASHTGTSASVRLQGLLPPAERSPPTCRRPGLLWSHSAPRSAEARPAVPAPPAARAEFWDFHWNAANLAFRPLRPPAGSLGPDRPAALPGSFLHSSSPGPAVRAYWSPRLGPSPEAARRPGEWRRRWPRRSSLRANQRGRRGARGQFGEKWPKKPPGEAR